MAFSSDFATIRANIEDAGSTEEQVHVNQRNLIDKILARYASEWSTLRELIQNAADARAEKVTIKFETRPSAEVPVPSSLDASETLKHVLRHHTLARLVVSNNGQPFTSTDWARLKSIADGNPDESKIGAFGVGFYSVFNDCDEPLVISARESMSFYWKENALFTRKGTLTTNLSNADTIFILDYRNSSFQIPSLLSLCKFLTTSLTFVGIEKLELWIDDWNLLRLSKKVAPEGHIDIPRGHSAVTRGNFVKISAVHNSIGQIDADFMNIIAWSSAAPRPNRAEQNSENTGLKSFFSRLTGVTMKGNSTPKPTEAEIEVENSIRDDVAGRSQASIFLRFTTADLFINCDPILSAELTRSTKKRPHQKAKISIAMMPYNPQLDSVLELAGTASAKAKDLFSMVIPAVGRVFIGFQTAQTTGFQAHVAAPSLIPTVEREQIDLSARYVSTWNTEILRAVGVLLRIGYHMDLSDIMGRQQWQLKDGKSLDISPLVPAAIHALRSYTSQRSTPSNLVAEIIEGAFWECNEKSILLLSTSGVLPNTQIRVTAENLSFISRVPILPAELIEKTSNFLGKLHDRGMVLEMSIDDIRKELEMQALNEEHLTELLKWIIKKLKAQELSLSMVNSLLQVVVLTFKEEAGDGSLGDTVIQLAHVTRFTNGSGMTIDRPLPPYVLPFRLTKALNVEQLLLLGWKQYSLIEWLNFLISSSSALPYAFNALESPEFAQKVLQIISRNWDSVKEKQQVVDLLSCQAIIPTKLGFRHPSKAYFRSVKIFDDLATINDLHGVKEKVLAALGVRKTLDLDVIFSRLLSPSNTADDSRGKWNHIDLIRYLASVKDDIPKDDLDRLHKAPLCQAEAVIQSDSHRSKTYTVSSLYQPTDEMRVLDLPILSWRGTLVPHSAEFKFLTDLGLNLYPDLPAVIQTLLKAISTGNATLWSRTLAYYIANFYINQYSKANLSGFQHEKILPTRDRSFPNLSTPVGCYANEDAAVLRYAIIKSELVQHAPKFGVLTDPDIHDCAARLIANPPGDFKLAKAVFGYMSTRLQEIDSQLAEKLGSALIVPVSSSGRPAESTSEQTARRYSSPRMCFLGDPTSFAKILYFVDFGPKGNAFLLRVGSKHEPTSADLATLLTNSPRRLLNDLGYAKYLDLLRRLSGNITLLIANKSLWQDLKSSQCLMGYRDVAETKKNIPEGENKEGATSVKQHDSSFDDEQFKYREWSLAEPSSITVIDGIEDFVLFRQDVLAAPQEDVIESFYQALGAPRLSSMVLSTKKVGSPLQDQSRAELLRKTLLERSQIFLSDQPRDQIRRDSRWLEKHMEVEAVQSISLTKKLRGQMTEHRVRVSASLDADIRSGSGKDGHYVLSVTIPYDLYQVAQTIISLLLTRYRQQDAMALEIILESDLRRLKMRGYNVDRILRQKELQAKLAAEVEKKRSADVEPMPAFEPGPPPAPAPIIQSQSAGAQQMPKAANGKFTSTFAKRLGLRTRDSKSSAEYPSAQNNDTGNGVMADSIRQNLTSAIRSSRAHGSSSVFSAPHAVTVKEAEKEAYCDATEGHDLVERLSTSSKMKVFTPRQPTERADLAFTKPVMLALDQFSTLLLGCASIYDVDSSTIHIFWNAESNAIAFNSNGSIFCNYHYFAQLHLPNLQSANHRSEALIYWFVVLAHELAHNLVKLHDSKHSFYTESFVQQYFLRAASMASKI